jgi:tetratricopeptide (TPR) repeat protein
MALVPTESTTPDAGSEVVGFIALWDEALGPTVEDSYPYTHTLGDIESLAVKVFLTFETVFGNATDGFKRTNIVLPLNAIARKAVILLETIPNPNVRGGLQPFILTLLIPETFVKDNAFDDVMNKIALKYLEKQRPLLRENFSDIVEIYRRENASEEGLLKLEDGYSISKAAEDFKMGVGFFKQQKFENAYPLLRKALVQFENDKQQQLILQAVYLISNIFYVQKRYQVGRNYYDRLEKLASELDHREYLELAQFMQGNCSYLIEDYVKAMEKFEAIRIDETKYTNKLQYFKILGKTYIKLDLFEKAVASLQRALEVSQKLPPSDKITREQAFIYDDLGLSYWQLAVTILTSKGFAEKDQMLELLRQAIKHYELGLGQWEKLQEFRMVIRDFQFIGNIHELLGEKEQMLQSYRNALEAAENMNDFSTKIRLLKKVIQIQDRLEMYTQNAIDLQHILMDLGNSAFADTLSMGTFHQQLGDALWALDQKKEAYEEYLAALNLLRKLKVPVKEELHVLKRITEFHQRKGEEEKVQYYTDQLAKTQDRFNKATPITVGKARRLGQVKEIWVFYETGIEIYSYCPETTLDPELLGGFLSALQSFSLELSKQTLNSMVIGEDRYFIYRKPEGHFYIMGRSGLKDSEMAVERTVRFIGERFFKEYQKTLENFAGNISAFKTFQAILDAIDFDTI